MLSTFLLLTLFAPGDAPAVHDEVVPKQAAGERVGASFGVYRVRRVDGDRLQLEEVSGWLRKDEVMTIDQALAFYTQEIGAKPRASVYSHRGYLFAYRGQLDRSLADYDAAIRLDPTSPITFSNRGFVWSQKKEPKRAIADFSEAIRLDAQDPLPFFNRAGVWSELGDHEKARADLDEAIRLDPSDARSFNNRGIEWWLSRNYDKALADFSEAIRLDPAYLRALCNRAGLWRDKKEHDKALRDADWAVRLDPKSAMALSTRGRIWFKKREYEKALADLQAAIRLDPEHDEAYFGLALLYATSHDAKYRDGKKGVENATRACELGEWKHLPHLMTLAAAHAESRDFDKALEWQRKANELCTEAADREEGKKFLELYMAKMPFRDEG